MDAPASLSLYKQAITHCTTRLSMGYSSASEGEIVQDKATRSRPPQPVTTPLTAEADLDRPHRGTTRNLAQTTITTINTTHTSAHTPAVMTTANTIATHTTVTRHTRPTPATTKTIQRSASVTTGARHPSKSPHSRDTYACCP
ncbi:unnamed protein product [Aureobasidium vineae]|uniref:Uncharacterized protein n=1 Tax=Aureobasidium vineae TaxID=2773715 RepID=A0A9N8JXZ0_9PEZI|nr:unnamed protein product [Aureobasidium vineae]